MNLYTGPSIAVKQPLRVVVERRRWVPFLGKNPACLNRILNVELLLSTVETSGFVLASYIVVIFHHVDALS